MNPSQMDTVNRVVKLVCRKFQVTPELIEGKSRRTDIVWSRWLAMYLCWKHGKIEHDEVGLLFKRDRTMIYHAICGVERLIAESETKERQLASLEDELTKTNNKCPHCGKQL